MVNPFDQNFFKFLLGFTCILIGAFAFIYLIQHYGPGLESKAAALLKSSTR